jgi:drug/metabolite transporter (DMT)-like permease
VLGSGGPIGASTAYAMLTVLSILFALCSAFANALNVVAQHASSVAAPKRMTAWRLGLYLVRQPLWLLGAAAMVAAFVFQGIALYHGVLSVVQPVLVTELIFSLVLRRLWLRNQIGVGAWASASVTTAGLGIFLVAAEPHGGHAQPTSGAWLSALTTMAALTIVCSALAARGSPTRRAALYGAASGIVWATLATFIKAAADNFSTGGVSGLFEHPPVYALVATGIIGTLLAQAALHTGPLAVSQPLMVTADPLMSVVLGVWLFGEHFQGAPIRTVLAVIAFLVMAGGVVFMARTAPSLQPAEPS